MPDPLRPRALIGALLACTATFLLMSTDRHFGFSVPVGALLTALAALALLDFLGTFRALPVADASAPCCFFGAPPAGARRRPRARRASSAHAPSSSPAASFCAAP